MKWPESMKAMAIASNILIAGASSRIPVIYRFKKEKYNELKAKGLSLEFLIIGD